MYNIDVHRRVRSLVYPAVVTIEPRNLGRRGLRVFQVVRPDFGAQLFVVRVEIGVVIDCHDAHPRIVTRRRIAVPAIVSHDFTEGIAVRDFRQVVKPCAMVVQVRFAPDIDRALAAARAVDIVAEPLRVRLRWASRLCIRILHLHGIARRTYEPLRVPVRERIRALAESIVEGDGHDRRADAVRRHQDLQSVRTVKVAALPGADANAVFLDAGHARIARDRRHAAIRHRVIGRVADRRGRHDLQLNVTRTQILGRACRGRHSGVDRTPDVARAYRRIPVAGFRKRGHRHQAHKQAESQKQCHCSSFHMCAPFMMLNL